MEIELKCTLCNNYYKSKSGLYKHVKSQHSYYNINNRSTTNINLPCSYCKKVFKHRQSRWRHEQSCQSKNEPNLLDKVNELSEKVKALETKPSIINNTTNNTTNIQYIINAPGTENLNHLTIENQREIMKKGLNSLIYLIELLNFNKEIPENHSYCVT